MKDGDWPRSPIDPFILARLEAAGLTPSPPADRRTLLRRAYYDLIGLPPTLEEIEAFERDRSRRRLRPRGRPAARLAALRRALGPALARRRPLCRHQGRRAHVRRRPGPALRLHLPRLRDPGLQRGHALRPVHPRAARRRRGRAQGSSPGGWRRWASSRWAGCSTTTSTTRSTTGSTPSRRGLLGLTVACARCHDHKYDPIPTADYYSLYGVFASSEPPLELPLIERPGELARLRRVREAGGRQAGRAAEVPRRPVRAAPGSGPPARRRLPGPRRHDRARPAGDGHLLPVAGPEDLRPPDRGPMAAVPQAAGDRRRPGLRPLARPDAAPRRRLRRRGEHRRWPGGRPDPREPPPARLNPLVAAALGHASIKARADVAPRLRRADPARLRGVEEGPAGEPAPPRRQARLQILEIVDRPGQPRLLPQGARPGPTCRAARRTPSAASRSSSTGWR